MAESLTLKWGGLKAWDVESDEAMAFIEKYFEDPVSMSAAAQRNTPNQVDAICGLIDVVDGEIWNDWDGVVMTKDEAKKYVMEYPNPLQ